MNNWRMFEDIDKKEKIKNNSTVGFISLNRQKIKNEIFYRGYNGNYEPLESRNKKCIWATSDRRNALKWGNEFDNVKVAKLRLVCEDKITSKFQDSRYDDYDAIELFELTVKKGFKGYWFDDNGAQGICADISCFEVVSENINEVVEEVDNKIDDKQVTEKDMIEQIKKLEKKLLNIYIDDDAIRQDSATIIITPNGTVIDTVNFDTHGEFLDYVYNEIVYGVEDEDDEHYDDGYSYAVEVLNFMTLNTGDGFSEDRCKVVICNKMSSMQASLLTEWLERRVREEKPIYVFVNGQQKTYEPDDYNYSSGGIIKSIQRSFLSGILESRINEEENNGVDINSITEKDVLNAVEKLSDKDDISYNDFEAIENNYPVILLTPSGEILNVDYYDTHSQFMDAVFSFLNVKEFEADYEMAYDYVIEKLGFITLNTGDGYSDDRCKIIIYSRLTQEQVTLLREWIKRRIKEDKPIIVFVKNEQKTFYTNEYTYDVGSIIKSIQRSFSTGILENINFDYDGRGWITSTGEIISTNNAPHYEKEHKIKNSENHVKYNFGYERYIGLPENRLSFAQYETLTKLLDYFFINESNVGIRSTAIEIDYDMNDKGDFKWKLFSPKTHTTDDIIKLIKRYYTTGRLNESSKNKIDKKATHVRFINKYEYEKLQKIGKITPIDTGMRWSGKKAIFTFPLSEYSLEEYFDISHYLNDAFSTDYSYAVLLHINENIKPILAEYDVQEVEEILDKELQFDVTHDGSSYLVPEVRLTHYSKDNVVEIKTISEIVNAKQIEMQESLNESWNDVYKMVKDEFGTTSTPPKGPAYILPTGEFLDVEKWWNSYFGKHNEDTDEYEYGDEERDTLYKGISPEEVSSKVRPGSFPMHSLVQYYINKKLGDDSTKIDTNNRLDDDNDTLVQNGCIKVNSGETLFDNLYVNLPNKRPTNQALESLDEYIFTQFYKNDEDILRVYVQDNPWTATRYKRDDYPDTKEIIKKITKYYTSSGKLEESKDDINRFIKWAGKELADRYFKQKAKMKSPYNDITWVMKNYTNKKEFEEDVYYYEKIPTRSDMNKKGKEGAKLIYSDKNWKVYKIDTYEAAVKYGKNTQWCLTGTNTSDGDDISAGREHYNKYVEDGYELYFYIYNKNNDKYALIYANDNDWQLFDSADFLEVCSNMSSPPMDTWNPQDTQGYHPDFPKVKGLPDINKVYDDYAKEMGIFDDTDNDTLDEAVETNSFTPYTAGYILEDGSLLVMDEYHGEEEIREFYPEYSNTHPEEDTCVRLYSRPNEAQYKRLEEIIDYYLNHEFYCKVEVWDKPLGNYSFYEVYSLYEGACKDTTWNEKIGNWTGYKLVQIIKNYFAKRVIEGIIKKSAEYYTSDEKLGESSVDEKLSVPKYLYHATYKPFLKSIKEKGLGNTRKKMWTDSASGVVYLATDEDVAYSYAENAEWLDDVEDYDKYADNIVILKIDTDKLDKTKFKKDSNVIDGDDTFEYHGVISFEFVEEILDKHHIVESLSGKEKEVIDTLDKYFGQKETYVWSTYILPNGHFLNPENYKKDDAEWQNSLSYEHEDFDFVLEELGFFNNRVLEDYCIKVNVTFPYVAMPNNRATPEQFLALRKLIDRRDEFEYSFDEISDSVENGSDVYDMNAPLIIILNNSEIAVDLDSTDVNSIVKMISRAYTTGTLLTESTESEQSDKRDEIEDRVMKDLGTSSEPIDGPSYIMRDGSFLKIWKANVDINGMSGGKSVSGKAQHLDVDGYISKHEPQFRGSYYLNHNCIRVNTGFEEYMVMSKVRPNSKQFDSLLKWLDYYFINHSKIQVLDWFGSSVNSKIYYAEENLPEDIIKKIKRYYATGTLVEKNKFGESLSDYEEDIDGIIVYRGEERSRINRFDNVDDEGNPVLYNDVGFSGLFFSADEYDVRAYGIPHKYKISNKAKIYKGYSSEEYCDDNNLRDIRDDVLYEISDGHTLKEIEDLFYEKKLDDMNSIFGARQYMARKHLEKQGYDGAHWEYEDDLTPEQYQIWNPFMITYIGSVDEFDE